MNTFAVAFVMVVVSGLTGFGIGWYESDLRWTAKTAQEAAKRQDAIDAARARASASEADLEALKAKLAQTDRRLRNEIRTSTEGRACLSARAVGVLNAAAGARVPDHARDDGGPGAVASDTDVAEWAAQVIGQYERCRGQLAAIRSAIGTAPIGAPK